MNPMFNFLLALTAVLAATTANAQPVLDMDGDIIISGGSYYVLPAAVGGQGGGLTLSGRGDKPCPLDIVQESSDVDVGIPVKFSNWRSRVGFVPESMNLNIRMDIAATICVQSTYWWVDAKKRVTAGPKPEGFGKESLRSFFQIQKAEEYFYKFAFCPSARAGSNIVSVPESGCFDVGIFKDKNGVRRLALTNKPFLVWFKKASMPEGSSKTMSI